MLAFVIAACQECSLEEGAAKKAASRKGLPRRQPRGRGCQDEQKTKYKYEFNIFADFFPTLRRVVAERVGNPLYMEFGFFPRSAARRRSVGNDAAQARKVQIGRFR